MKQFLLIFSLSLIMGCAFAQQDPLYAQYFNNPMLINPAFAGSHERLYAGIAYRSQWAGIQGGPETFNFNSHVSVLRNKIGLGVYAVRDQLGDIQNTIYGTSFAYRIKLNDATFTFGMQVGATRYATNPDAITLKNNPDLRFASFSETNFNTGAGLLLQSDKYLIGISVPQLLANSVIAGDELMRVSGRNWYVYGGYIFFISEQIRFKPSALLRATTNTPVAIDLNANLEFNRKYTAGVFTRGFNSYGTLLQMVMGDFRLGYVYEIPGKQSALNFDTHEISLSLSLNVLHGHSVVNGL